MSIAPAAGTIIDGTSLTFSATGGAPPYSYSVVSGPGIINSSTGVFTASGGGTVIIRVSDKNKKTSDATINVTPTGVLTINPAAASVNVNSAIQFVAVGGTSPYTFGITSTGSGSPTINSGTGLYRSGFTLGTDQVTVTEAASATATATVTVTATATNVDYTIQSVNLPAGGTGGKAVLAGYNFTVKNNGVAGGSRPLSWWVYLSDSSTFNTAGMQILTNNVAGSLAAAGTVTIPITGTWPVVPIPAGATKYLFFEIAADDDLNSSNNVAGPYAVTLLPPNVDYSATFPTHTSPLVAGGALSESFTLQNNGADAGSQGVHWTAYVSTNLSASISGDTVIAAGIVGPLGASPASTAIGPITGTWPSAPGSYYLKVQLSAADDINTANNIQVSTVYATTYVDYTPVQVQLRLAGQVAGGPLNGEFQLQNLGNANGTQSVAWTAYVAPTLTPTTATVLASDTTSPVNALATSGFIFFTGTWPTTPGNYVLIVSVSSSEDTNAANNVVSTLGYGVIPPSVDYAVSAVTNTGAATAPVMGPMNGSFHLSNGGPNNGTQYVSWYAYASPSGAVDSSAILITSGVSPPFAASGSRDILFSGQWPMRCGNYQLVVSVSAPIDVDLIPSNNVAASGSTSTAAVGFFDETTSDAGGDFTNLSNAMDLGITLQPGMSVQLKGSLNSADLDDVLKLSKGTAASVSLYMSWTGTYGVTLNFMSGPPLDSIGIIQFANTPGDSSLSLSVIVNPSVLVGTTRYIDVKNNVVPPPGNIGIYYLIITGN